MPEKSRPDEAAISDLKLVVWNELQRCEEIHARVEKLLGTDRPVILPALVEVIQGNLRRAQEAQKTVELLAAASQCLETAPDQRIEALLEVMRQRERNAEPLEVRDELAVDRAALAGSLFDLRWRRSQLEEAVRAAADQADRIEQRWGKQDSVHDEPVHSNA